MKEPIIREKAVEITDSKEQALIQQAVEMYDSRKYSLLEILQATGLSKITLYPYIQNRN